VVQVGGISQLIFSHLRGFEAFGCGSSVGLEDPACSLDLGAALSVQFGWLLASGKETDTSSLDISGFFLVVRAESEIVGQNGYIDPGVGCPVGIVISLFSAFESESVSVVVLSGVSGIVSVKISVGNPESSVSESGLAILVIRVTLVHSVDVSSGGSDLHEFNGIVGDGIGGRSISVSEGNCGVGDVCAHVLNDKVASVSSVSATVLSSPFDLEEGFFVEVFLSSFFGIDTVSSLGVILGVHETICVVSVVSIFVQSSI